MLLLTSNFITKVKALLPVQYLNHVVNVSFCLDTDAQTDNKQQPRDSKPAADANDDTRVHSDDHKDQNTDNAEEFADQVQQRRKPDEPLQSNESSEDSTEHAQMSKRADKVAELEDSNYL